MASNLLTKEEGCPHQYTPSNEHSTYMQACLLALIVHLPWNHGLFRPAIVVSPQTKVRQYTPSNTQRNPSTTKASRSHGNHVWMSIQRLNSSSIEKQAKTRRLTHLFRTRTNDKLQRVMNEGNMHERMEGSKTTTTASRSHADVVSCEKDKKRAPFKKIKMRPTTILL